MRRILALALTAFMLFTLVACTSGDVPSVNDAAPDGLGGNADQNNSVGANNGAEGTNTSGDSNTDDGNSDTSLGDSSADDGASDTVTAVNPFEQRSTQFTIVYPHGESEFYGLFAEKLRIAIADRTGCTVGIADDYTTLEVGEGITNDCFEILLGDTNRVESKKSKCPSGAFVINVIFLFTKNHRKIHRFGCKAIFNERILV